MKGLGIWALVFLCALGLALIVPLGGNFFGLPDAVLPPLFAANLTLFVWLLARFVGRPMGSFLEARGQGIAEELEEARRRLAEAESLRDEVRRRLDEVEREVTALRARAERDGAAEADEIAAQSAREQERFLERVEEEIRRRSAEARTMLSRETADLTARLTKELLDKELTNEDRRRILAANLSAMRSAKTGD